MILTVARKEFAEIARDGRFKWTATLMVLLLLTALLAGWQRHVPDIPPAALLIPVDTHIENMARSIGLTRRRTRNWKMAEEITARLRALDPDDPVKYDYALCHLGMMNACGFSRPQADAQCPLRGVCRPRARTRRRSPTPSARP